MTNEDPYSYEKFLIRQANKLIQKEKFLEAFRKCLIVYNNFHSGWVEEVNRIYYKPQNDIEQGLANQLRDINLKVAQGLLETVKPAASWSEYLNVEAICICLTRLEKGVPKELIERLRNLVSECKKLGAPDRAGLVYTVEELISKYCE